MQRIRNLTARARNRVINAACRTRNGAYNLACRARNAAGAQVARLGAAIEDRLNPVVDYNIRVGLTRNTPYGRIIDLNYRPQIVPGTHGTARRNDRILFTNEEKDDIDEIVRGQIYDTGIFPRVINFHDDYIIYPPIDGYLRQDEHGGYYYLVAWEIPRTRNIHGIMWLGTDIYITKKILRNVYNENIPVDEDEQEYDAALAPPAAAPAALPANPYANAPHIGELEIPNTAEDPIGYRNLAALRTEGTEMVNFQGELGHNRIYTRANFNALRASPSATPEGLIRNPATSAVVQPANVRYYRVRQPNVAGGKSRRRRTRRKV
jgi:hypothetical protein